MEKDLNLRKMEKDLNFHKSKTTSICWQLKDDLHFCQKKDNHICCFKWKTITVSYSFLAEQALAFHELGKAQPQLVQISVDFF